MTYLPGGVYPYTVLQQWVMAFGEVAIIVGIAMALASEGRWRVVGVLMVGIPVVLLGVNQILFVALPNWSSLGIRDKIVIVAGAGIVALGLFLQLAVPAGVGSKLFGRKSKGTPQQPEPIERPESDALS